MAQIVKGKLNGKDISFRVGGGKSDLEAIAHIQKMFPDAKGLTSELEIEETVEMRLEDSKPIKDAEDDKKKKNA